VSTIDAAAKTVRHAASESPQAAGGGEFILLGMPDVNGSIRGKALRPAAFESALRHGTVMTDLLLALDPTDTPISDYTKFGIRSGAGDLIVRPDPDTLHDLTWRPGWKICLATPSWPDGTPCELASREVLRHVLSGLSTLGYEAVAAVEYEMRLWDADSRPLSSGLSYSLGELGGFNHFIQALAPALEAVRGAYGSGGGPARAQPRRSPSAARRRRRGAHQDGGEGPRSHDGLARQLPRQDGAW
jgi:glutamine synthetase